MCICKTSWGSLRKFDETRRELIAKCYNFSSQIAGHYIFKYLPWERLLNYKAQYPLHEQENLSFPV